MKFDTTEKVNKFCHVIFHFSIELLCKQIKQQTDKKQWNKIASV